MLYYFSYLTVYEIIRMKYFPSACKNGPITLVLPPAWESATVDSDIKKKPYVTVSYGAVTLWEVSLFVTD